jgi:hypothetical protein
VDYRTINVVEYRIPPPPPQTTHDAFSVLTFLSQFRVSERHSDEKLEKTLSEESKKPATQQYLQKRQKQVANSSHNIKLLYFECIYNYANFGHNLCKIIQPFESNKCL